MTLSAENALIVQSDCSVLLETNAPRAAEARAAIAPFAELVKSPEHVHTYRLTPLSIWNARAAGLAGEKMVAALREHARYPVPENVGQEVLDLATRFGRVVIDRDDDFLRCTCADKALAELLRRDRNAGSYLAGRAGNTSFRVDPKHRGVLKQALVAAGYPAEDLAGYESGEALAMALRDRSTSGAPFVVREYQRQAAESFFASVSTRGGSGVIVLPCGAGKTIVGMAAMEMVGQTALVLTTSLTSVKQWRRELCDKTSLRPDEIAEYTGEHKDTGPVTLTTYQILTWRGHREGAFPHLELFRARAWGLIIYDEVHLLPAPVFRATADLQARRRLGLTATLVREDNREADVFALIGPKRFDVPWKDLESQSWIASATCVEERIPMNAERRMASALADRRSRFRIAAENPAKTIRLRQPDRHGIRHGCGGMTRHAAVSDSHLHPTACRAAVACHGLIFSCKFSRLTRCNRHRSSPTVNASTEPFPCRLSSSSSSRLPFFFSTRASNACCALNGHPTTHPARVAA